MLRAKKQKPNIHQMVSKKKKKERKNIMDTTGYNMNKPQKKKNPQIKETKHKGSHII